MRNCQTVFLQSVPLYLYCFAFLSLMSERSSGSAFSPAAGIIRSSPLFILAIIIGVLWSLIEVSICSSIMTNDVEHCFTCLFAVYKSSLIRHLIISQAVSTMYN